VLHALPGANHEPALCGAHGAGVRGMYVPAFRESVAHGADPCPTCLAVLSGQR
jgi:hypothetical protein